MSNERDNPNGKPRIFDSKEERDRWQVQTYGQVRNGWREPGEMPDGRALIRRDPFWDSTEEQDAYEAAARKIQMQSDFKDLPFEQQLGLIVAAAGDELNTMRAQKPVESMPKLKPMSTVAYNERMAQLRAQARGMAHERSAPPARMPTRQRRLHQERMDDREPGEDG